MSNQIIPFDYQNHEVRSLLIEGEPWFVAKDVCEILDLGNPSQAISRLDEDERNTIISNEGIGNPEKSVISESGLYSLTLGSKKPEAKPFKRWITHEVIPAIRKTGTYSTQPMTQIQMLAAQAQMMVQLENRTSQAIESANSAKESANNANQRVFGALNALAAPTDLDWQAATKNKITRIAEENQLSYVVLYGDLYKELEYTAHVDLKRRVDCLRGRMKKAGHTYKEQQDVNKLHVIGLDPKLKLAFDGIVRRVDAKYTATRLPQ